MNQDLEGKLTYLAGAWTVEYGPMQYTVHPDDAKYLLSRDEGADVVFDIVEYGSRWLCARITKWSPKNIETLNNKEGMEDPIYNKTTYIQLEEELDRLIQKYEGLYWEWRRDVTKSAKDRLILLTFKEELKAVVGKHKQKCRLIEMMRGDEELGLYENE